MARWNAETRGIQAAFRGKPICARCDRPTFGPGLCSECHTRFRQGLSDALFTIGAMVAVPCVVGAVFLWVAHGREIAGGRVPEGATIILGRAMSGDVAGIFWHLAISALTAAMLSIGSFLLLDLPRVLRREERTEIDWRDMVASLKDIRLLFEKRVTPAGPRPGEPESANPLDYQTAMQQLHSMLGIEGDIPPDPTADEDEPASESTGEQPLRGPAVKDVETIESHITSPRERTAESAEPVEEPAASEDLPPTTPETPTEEAPEPEPVKVESPLPAAQPPEPAEEEVRDVHPPLADAEPESADIDEDPAPEPDEPVETSTDEDPAPESDEPVETSTDEDPAPEPDEPVDELPGEEVEEPDRPIVQVKDSPFAQRHRLRRPLFETTPPPPGQNDSEDGPARPRTPSVVDDLLDESVAQLFDRPALPGLLQVKTSEWDDLPAAEFVAEDPADTAEQAQPPHAPEIEWLDEEQTPADAECDDILDVEPVPVEPEQPPTPAPASPPADATINELPGENDEADTIDSLLGEPEESSTIDEMLDDLLEPPQTEPADQPEPPVAEDADTRPAATDEEYEESPVAETSEADLEESPESTSAPSGEAEPPAEPAAASILLRGPKGSAGIETSLTDADGNVACPGCGRRKPSPGPGRYHCSSCQSEFVIPRVLARCPGCGRERPSPGPGVYQCSQCTTTFRIPPMVSCPGCGRSKPSPGTGRLRCSACGTVFEVVNETGAVR